MPRIHCSRVVVTLCVVAALLLVACSGRGEAPGAPRSKSASAPDATPDLWRELRTPLRLTRLDPGAGCPITSSRSVAAWIGPAQGDGPVYPVGLSVPISLTGPPSQDGLFLLKTAWVSDAGYTGLALVRGQRLDAAGDVQFQLDKAPEPELRLPLEGAAWTAGQDPGWRAWTPYTLVPGPGCYRLQVDGDGFTRTIVFEVVP